MYRVALLTCALLWLTGAGARIYERCELARELSALGVRPDHLSTWVCIAYHESRFDTNANNPYSGDHGIFQISQLYWCGPGKACGLPCSALHDDDITDDLDCAFIVHEEHTRLQGNGFLAWVVYPQHCKHNTKKYLVDCDLDSKNSVLLSKPRRLQYANSFDERNDTADRQNVEKLLPPYLSIGNVIRENYDKVIDENRGRFDWYNYKIDNIDELRLPVFNQPSQHISLPQTTSAPRTTTTTTTTTVAPRRTTTATTPYVPRLKVWRVIETNQFRKKKKFSETIAESATPKLEYTTELSRYTQSTRASTALELPSTRLYSLSTPTTPRVTTTTLRPTTKTTVSTTAYRSPTYAFTYGQPPSTTTYRPPVSTTTYTPWTFKPFTFSTTYKPSSSLLTTRQWQYSITTTTTSKPTTTTTTRRPTTTTTTRKPTTTTTTRKPTTTTTTRRPTTTTTTTRRPTTTTTTTRKPTTTTTTRKPTTTTVAPRTITTTYRTPTTTTIKPITTTTTRKPTTPWTWSATTSKKPTVATEKPVTRKPKSDFSWYTFTSRTATTPASKLQTFSQTKTTQPFTYSTKTQNNAQTATTKALTYSTTNKPPTTTTQKPKTTQSIFDLYLNPTKAPQLPSYKFSWGESKLKIFAGGTTTTPATTRSNEPTNNFTKRRT